jgi:hypothetical protein
MAAFLAPPLFWDQVEPAAIEPEARAPHSCYSKQLKVDLLSGTFVYLLPLQRVRPAVEKLVQELSRLWEEAS